MSRRSTSAPRNEARGTEVKANAAVQADAVQADAAQASAAGANSAQANGAQPASPRASGSRASGSRANGARGGQSRSHHGIPEATVARLPIYLRALYALADRDTATVSSEELAAAAGVNSAKLRKDLSHLGSYGTRGVGYDVEYLVYQVSRELGLTQDWPVVIVGAGNLGRALANYGGFASRGFRIAALLDCDPAVVGTTIARHTVRSAADIEDVVATHAVSIGVIATPAAAAQDVCDRLLAAGVTSILNFAPVVLNVPSGVDVRKVDLSIELQILAFHAQRRAIVGMTQEREWQERRARRGGERGDREPDASTALALGGESGVEAQAVGT
jgi:redox-sensing transcriptional repressor